MFDTLLHIPLEKRYRQLQWPLPVVVTIIRRMDEHGENRRYLLIKRNEKPYQGMWALVGGKWDFGETMAAVAIREVLEETGLTTIFIGLKGLVNERLINDKDENRGGHFLIFVCEVMANAGIAATQYEGEVAWFTPAEIEHLHQNETIIPSDYAMLHQFAWADNQLYIEAGMVHLERENAGKPVLDHFIKMTR